MTALGAAIVWGLIALAVAAPFRRMGTQAAITVLGAIFGTGTGVTLLHINNVALTTALAAVVGGEIVAAAAIIGAARTTHWAAGASSRAPWLGDIPDDWED